MDLNWDGKPHQPLLLESEWDLIRACLAEVREALEKLWQKPPARISQLLSRQDKATWSGLWKITSTLHGGPAKWCAVVHQGNRPAVEE